tara:strand:- start:24 stop:278 length:255 start_codon:yes stop_codon:yes gene_type:complete
MSVEAAVVVLIVMPHLLLVDMVEVEEEELLNPRKYLHMMVQENQEHLPLVVAVVVEHLLLQTLVVEEDLVLLSLLILLDKNCLP